MAVGNTNQARIDWISWIQRLILFLCSVMVAWAMAQIAELQCRTNDNTKEIVLLKGTRFTNKDGETHLMMITRNETIITSMSEDIRDIKQSQKEMLALLHNRQRQ
jgi:hypothetical protein